MHALPLRRPPTPPPRFPPCRNQRNMLGIKLRPTQLLPTPPRGKPYLNRRAQRRVSMACTLTRRRLEQASSLCLAGATTIKSYFSKRYWPGLCSRSPRPTPLHSHPSHDLQTKSLLHPTHASRPPPRRRMVGPLHNPDLPLAPRPSRPTPSQHKHHRPTGHAMDVLRIICMARPLPHHEDSPATKTSHSVPPRMVPPLRFHRHSLRHGNSLRAHRTAHGNRRHRARLHHRDYIRHRRSPPLAPHPDSLQTTQQSNHLSLYRAV